jgi:hypothetical protein
LIHRLFEPACALLAKADVVLSVILVELALPCQLEADPLTSACEVAIARTYGLSDAVLGNSVDTPHRLHLLATESKRPQPREGGENVSHLEMATTCDR